MKKSVNVITFSLLVFTGSILTSCQSDSKKMENAQENVQEAKQDLNEAKQDANAEAQKIADAEAWKAFKVEANEKIRTNDERIAELKVKMKKSGKVMDSVYEKKINNLEEKNNELRAKLDAYDKNQSNWESFKTEFNHDMDELGKAFNDLTVDNKK